MANLQGADELAIEIQQPNDLEGPYSAYVYDGDTIGISNDEKKLSVRLIGVDAPEVESDYKQAECFGRQARTYLADKVHRKQVYLEYDEAQGNVDGYGRLLRYVWVDGEMLNLALIMNGYAKEFTYNDAYRYKSEFEAAQAKAKRDGLGLWTTCAK